MVLPILMAIIALIAGAFGFGLFEGAPGVLARLVFAIAMIVFLITLVSRPRPQSR